MINPSDEVHAWKKARAAERKARWRAKHPGAEASYNRAYYEINRLERLARAKIAYRKKHPRRLKFSKNISQERMITEEENETILVMNVFAKTIRALSPEGKKRFFASIQKTGL